MGSQTKKLLFEHDVKTTEDEDTVPGMGAAPHDSGTTFRVWAPSAAEVYVFGDFNDWDEQAHPLDHEDGGYWATNVAEAQVGHEYKYRIVYEDQSLYRMDPYARQVTSSVGNSIITEATFDWEDEDFQMPSWNDLVIYEMHVGTFADDAGGDDKPGTFESAIDKLPYLRDLGINAIEVMPPMEFPGGISWGYNPALPFAIESDYGGPHALKAFINAAHKEHIAVILDVVYNHFGPSDLALWRFDGWHQDDYGGIYFYNDERAETPWGKTRPDYGRPEVRQYLRDNAMMWIHEYHLDGLRWDSTSFIRNIKGNEGDASTDLPDGWSLMQQINHEIQEDQPHVLSIAEEVGQEAGVTVPIDQGGAGFGSQWDVIFAISVRPALVVADDASRGLTSVRDALLNRIGDDAFHRVIYTESHDEVANGRQRIPEAIWPGNARSWFSKKRSTLGAALVFTAPGVPMIFQGQEFMEDRWFSDQDPLDWHLTEEMSGIVDLYRDLMRLRLNRDGITEGLRGQHAEVPHLNQETKILTLHRWADGGPKDSVMAVFNFSGNEIKDYTIGFPRAGLWKLRFDSHAAVYDGEFDNQVSHDTEAGEEGQDGLPARGVISIAPYSAIIYSQDE